MVDTRGKRALPPEGAAQGVFDDHVGRATRGRRPCRLPDWLEVTGSSVPGHSGTQHRSLPARQAVA